MHALILMTVLAQWAPREAPHYGHTRESRRMGNRSLVGQGYAFFEFAPASGAGMPSACSTTAPTGAKGEVLTFTRTGNATCSKKGLATTGIADGDLVVMSGNVARVEPDADGVLGLRVEGARTNSVLRSEEIDNASWVYVITGAPAPTFQGANIAVAPDGTLTAEGFTFAATTSGQASVRAQAATAALSGIASYSVFVKGQSGSGTLDVCRYGGVSTAECTPCSYVADSWTRCVHVKSTSPSENSNIAIGNSTKWNGGTARDANAVYVWGAQGEAGAYATSYIPTVAAAVTRNVENANFAPSWPTSTTISMAASVQGPILAGSAQAVLAMHGYSSFINTYVTVRFSGSASVTAPFTAATSAIRTYGYDNGTNVFFSWAGQTNSAAAGAAANRFGTPFYVGREQAGFAADSIISRVCVDPDPTRCR